MRGTKNLELLQQATLALALCICVGIAFSIILWAQEDKKTPLKSNITMNEAIKIRDVLIVYDISHELDLRFKTVYVAQDQYAQAVTAAKSVGIQLPELPKYSEIVAKQMESAAIEQDYQPVYEQPWFMKMIRLFVAGCVICVLIIVVMRPMIVKMLRPDYDELDEWIHEEWLEYESIDQNSQQDDTNQSQHESTTSLMQISVLRQAALFLALTACVGIAIAIIINARQPEMRPLINDLRKVDAVQVVDILEQHEIMFKVDSDEHMVYVAYEHSNYARVLLSKIGLNIEYPAYSEFDEKMLEMLNDGEPDPNAIYNQPWFFQLTKLALSALTIIVLILVVMRPMLKLLIYPEDLDGAENA